MWIRLLSTMRLPFWEKFFRPRSAAEVPRLQDLWLHRLKSLHDHAVLCIVGSHWHVLSPLAYWCQGDIVRLLRWDVAKSLGYWLDWAGEHQAVHSDLDAHDMPKQFKHPLLVFIEGDATWHGGWFQHPPAVLQLRLRPSHELCGATETYWTSLWKSLAGSWHQLAVLPCFMWILVVWKVTPELVSCRLSPRSAKLPERPNHPISGLNSGPMVRTHSRDGAANSSRKSSISACQYLSMSSNLLKYWTSSKLITWIGCSQGTFQRRLQRPFAYQALGHTFCSVTGQPMYLAWELDTKVDQSRPYCVAVELGRSSTDLNKESVDGGGVQRARSWKSIHCWPVPCLMQGYNNGTCALYI